MLFYKSFILLLLVLRHFFCTATYGENNVFLGCHLKVEMTLIELASYHDKNTFKNIVYNFRPSLHSRMRTFRADPVHQHDAVLEYGPRAGLQRVHVRVAGYNTARVRAHRVVLYSRHVARQAPLHTNSRQEEGS